MAGKVFFSVSMSLDGCIAPESLGDLMGQPSMEQPQWITIVDEILWSGTTRAVANRTRCDGE